MSKIKTLSIIAIACYISYAGLEIKTKHLKAKINPLYPYIDKALESTK